MEKRPLLANGQRRHTVGHIPRVAELTEKQNLIKIYSSKVGSSDLLPALFTICHENSNSYIILRD